MGKHKLVVCLLWVLSDIRPFLRMPLKSSWYRQNLSRSYARWAISPNWSSGSGAERRAWTLVPCCLVISLSLMQQGMAFEPPRPCQQWKILSLYKFNYLKRLRQSIETSRLKIVNPANLAIQMPLGSRAYIPAGKARWGFIWQKIVVMHKDVFCYLDPSWVDDSDAEYALAS